MTKVIILMVLLLLLSLSGCSSESSDPYEEIDLQRFMRVSIIEISPKVYFSENKLKNSKPYQIAKVKLIFKYNDLIKSSVADFPYKNGDIINALVTEDDLQVLNGANEFISPSWLVNRILYDEEGTELEFLGITFPGGEGSKALIFLDENKEEKLSFVFDGEYSRVYTVYNKRIKGSGNELYDGCNTDQFTKWFLSVSKSYNRQIM